MSKRKELVCSYCARSFQRVRNNRNTRCPKCGRSGPHTRVVEGPPVKRHLRARIILRWLALTGFRCPKKSLCAQALLSQLDIRGVQVHTYVAEA